MDLKSLFDRNIDIDYNISIKSHGKYGAEISVEGNKMSLMVGLAALVSTLKSKTNLTDKDIKAAVEVGLLGDVEAKKLLEKKKDKWNKIIKILEEN